MLSAHPYNMLAFQMDGGRGSHCLSAIRLEGRIQSARMVSQLEGRALELQNNPSIRFQSAECQCTACSGNENMGKGGDKWLWVNLLFSNLQRAFNAPTVWLMFWHKWFSIVQTLKSEIIHGDQHLKKQARKLQATLEGCNPKLWITYSLTGVKCRATSVAKKHQFSCSISFQFL